MRPIAFQWQETAELYFEVVPVGCDRSDVHAIVEYEFFDNSWSVATYFTRRNWLGYHKMAWRVFENFDSWEDAAAFAERCLASRIYRFSQWARAWLDVDRLDWRQKKLDRMIKKANAIVARREQLSDG